MLLPPVAALRRFGPPTWAHPAMAAPAVLAVFLITYTFDCLMNAMINPIYLVALGGLSAMAMSPTITCRRPSASQRIADPLAVALR
jgi:hypothetical protein